MSSRQSLTREDWVDAAQLVLLKSGVDAVRVDTLAKEMGITRGSFYYHFKSRGDLLDAILSKWRARATEDVILQLREAHSSPHVQLERLLELPLHGQTAKDAAGIEIAIRAWARRDIQARQAIDEVDRHRLSYIEGLLLQAKVPSAEAGDRAHLIYAYQISLALLQTGESSADRSERNGRIARLLAPVC